MTQQERAALLSSGRCDPELGDHSFFSHAREACWIARPWGRLGRDVLCVSTVCLAALGILGATNFLGLTSLGRHGRASSSLPEGNDHSVVGLSDLPGLPPLPSVPSVRPEQAAANRQAVMLGPLLPSLTIDSDGALHVGMSTTTVTSSRGKATTTVDCGKNLANPCTQDRFDLRPRPQQEPRPQPQQQKQQQPQKHAPVALEGSSAVAPQKTTTTVAALPDATTTFPWPDLDQPQVGLKTTATATMTTTVGNIAGMPRPAGLAGTPLAGAPLVENRRGGATPAPPQGAPTAAPGAAPVAGEAGAPRTPPGALGAPGVPAGPGVAAPATSPLPPSAPTGATPPLAEGCRHLGCGKFVVGRTCQCNSGCENFHDCCTDYWVACRKPQHGNSTGQGGAGGTTRSTTPAPPPPPTCQLRPTAPGLCKKPRIMARAGIAEPEQCMCPPPMVPHTNTSCNECYEAKAPQRMTFYMYRAMGPETYPMENVNMASLAGVMWYLHREVVGSTPRKFHITRILRYSVTMMVTQDYFNKTPNQFGPFVAFDSGSAKGRKSLWADYGYVVGCQLVDPKLFNYVPPRSLQPSCFSRDSFACRAPKWYSLPGPCPEEKVPDKDASCRTGWPGGMCPTAVVTGAHTCTYFTAPAGEISLDELEGIQDYESWWIGTNASNGAKTPNGNIEYDFDTDTGVGMDFWNGRHDEANCTRRMDSVVRLFKQKYPTLPQSLPEPPCV